MSSGARLSGPRTPVPILIFSPPRCGSTAIYRALGATGRVRLAYEPVFVQYREGAQAVQARQLEILEEFDGFKHVFDPTGFPFEPRHQATIGEMDRNRNRWIELNRIVLSHPAQRTVFLRRRDQTLRIVSDLLGRATENWGHSELPMKENDVANYRRAVFENELPELSLELVRWYGSKMPAIELELRSAADDSRTLDLWYEDLFDDDAALVSRLEVFDEVERFLGCHDGGLGVDRRQIQAILDPEAKLNPRSILMRVPGVESILGDAPSPRARPPGSGEISLVDIAGSWQEWNAQCRSGGSPGLDESDDWRDWTDHDTTVDQLRIEDVLDSRVTAGDRVLHIGIGNSSLARRVCLRGAVVVGTTIRARELFAARRLGLSGYDCFLINKYTSAMTRLLPSRSFQYIVDNNPSTFACCAKHLGLYFQSVSCLLRQNGLWLTDRLGLGHTSSASTEPRGLTEADLVHVGSNLGLRVRRITGAVLALEKLE